MANTRPYLGPLDGYDRQIQWQHLVTRLNSRLVHWVFGSGFLLFHLALFVSALLVSLCWNLIASPSDLRIVEPFRYWGIVAIVHTILAGGGILGWRLFQMGHSQQRSMQIPAHVHSNINVRPVAQNRGQAWQSAWSRGYESIQRANTTARRWTASPQKRIAPWGTRDVKAGWPEQASGVAPLGNSQHRDLDVGEATWPDTAPLSTMLSAGSDSRSGTGADQVVSVDHRSSDASGNPSQTWVEGFIASRSRDKEHRWSWVEAAASSWLSRKEPSVVAGSEPEVQRESNDFTSLAPDPENEQEDAPPV